MRAVIVMAEGDVSPHDVAMHFVDLIRLGSERPAAWLMVDRFVRSFR